MTNLKRKLEATIETLVANVAFADSTEFTVPTTTLTSPVLAHADQWALLVEDVTGFKRYGHLKIWDGVGNSFGDGFDWPTGPMLIPSAEEMLAIADVDEVNSIITLDSKGIGYDGLQFAHAIGATVAANLNDKSTTDTQASLNSGDPYVWVSVTEQQDGRDTGGAAGRQSAKRYWSLVRAVISYTINLLPKQGSINATVYSNRQQDRASEDMDAITNAIITNPELKINNAPQGLGLGDSRGIVSVRNWTRTLVPGASDRFEVGADIIIRAAGSNY